LLSATIREETRVLSFDASPYVAIRYSWTVEKETRKSYN
jgi:hypothetical protein